MMKNLVRSILPVLAIGLLFTGCKKDDPSGDQAESGSNSVYVQFYHYSGGSPFAFNTNYMDSYGNVFQFNTARMYLSETVLRDMSAESNACFFNYMLISPDSVNPIFQGTVGDVHAHTIEFNVGVDSATNHSDPAVWPAGHPLAPQSPSIHWGWSMGYIFFMIGGMVDTTGDGIVDSPWEFHVGTDALLRNSGSIMIHEDIDSDHTIGIDVDWAAFLTGIDLSTDNVTHTGDNLPLATQAADNVPLLFTEH